jgi:hypothetical protein
LDAQDKITIEINYHYKNSPYDPVCRNLALRVIQASWFSDPRAPSESIEKKRQEIFIKHYIDAQFSLDNGLFKESVLNFGTALEVLLNRDLLDRPRFHDRIDKCSGLSMFKDEMHTIQKYRNRVHPSQLKGFSDVVRHEAQECRQIMERILRVLA